MLNVRTVNMLPASAAQRQVKLCAMAGSDHDDKEKNWNEICSSFIENLKTVEVTLQNLWNDIGLDQTLLSKRVVRVFSVLNEVLQEMVNEESQLLSNLKRRVANYMKKIDILSHELNQKQEELNISNTLLTKEKQLREVLEKLELKKKNIILEWEKTEEYRKSIFQRLGITYKITNFQGVPTPNELASLVSSTNEHEKELKAREAIFIVLKGEISNFTTSMDYPLTDEFLTSVLMPNSEISILLSEQNLKKIRELKENLEQELFEIEAKIKRLWDSIHFLWKLLNVDDKFCETFKNSNSKFTLKVCENLKAEESRLHSLRLEKLSNYIPKLKEELISAWNKCRFGQKKREQFIKVYGSQISEESLTAHEEALLSAMEYYNKNSPILSLLEKRDELWEKHVRLELPQTSIEKFTNRGGVLLKEEKLRKKVAKELPKLETELLKSVEEWEKRQNSTFLVDDIPLQEYIESQHESLKMEKDHQRQIRNLNKTNLNTPTRSEYYKTLNSTRLNSTNSKPEFICTDYRVRVRKAVTPIVPFTPQKRRSSATWPKDLRFITPKSKIYHTSKNSRIKNPTVLAESSIQNISPAHLELGSPILKKAKKDFCTPSDSKLPKTSGKYFEPVMDP